MKKLVLIAILATTMIFNAQAYKNKLIEQNTESLLFKNRVQSPMDKMHGTLDAFDLQARQQVFFQHVTGTTTVTDQAGKVLRIGAATTFKIRLDSLVYRFAADSLNMKGEYAYDANGNNTINTIYSWNSISNQWVGRDKTETTYDANGNETLHASYLWNSTFNQWMYDSKVKSELTYDGIGNIILNTIYSWNSTTNQWVCSGKLESVYDGNGNIILNTSYSWNSTSNQWVGSSKTESTYDANGNNTLETDYNWDANNNQWVGRLKLEYTYDTNSKKTLETHYSWDTNNNQWVGSLKLEYTYDTNSKKTLETHYNWNSNNNQWVGSSKTEYTYDANGNNTIFTNYSWNSTSNQWVGSSKTESTYDMYGNIIFDTVYDWNNSTNQWMANSKAENTYDYSHLAKDIVSRSSWWFNQFINPPTLTNVYAFDGTSWSFYGSETCYYSAISNTAIPELAISKLKVYTTAFEIIVEGTSVGETVILHTLNGVTVQAQKSIGTSIVLTVKNKGVYMLKTANKTFKVVL